MKYMSLLLGLVFMLTMSGCLFFEKIETRIRFFDNDTPPQVTTIYHNISSIADKEKEVEEDFRELIDHWKGDKFLIEQLKEGLLVKDRQLLLEGDSINFKVSAILTEGYYLDLVAKGERIMIIEDADESKILETNGKVLKTEENFVIVWPEELKEIYWIQSHVSIDDDDRKQIDRNRTSIVEKVRNYLKNENQN